MNRATTITASVANVQTSLTGATASVAVVAAMAGLQTGIGLSSTFPAQGCQQIFSLFPASPSGVYWIRYNNGVATQIFCNMNIYGGGWDLLVKIGPSATFQYSADLWSTGNTLNAGSNLDANFGTDNKYSSYNVGLYHQLLIRFSFSTTQWDWPVIGLSSSFPVTAMSFFNGPAQYWGSQRGTAFFTNGNSNGAKWSAQDGYQQFGINVCCGGTPGTCVRMGFIWNNEGECSSNDASGGLGMNFRAYGVGDAYGCCQTVTGVNTWFSAQIYGRRLF